MPTLQLLICSISVPQWNIVKQIKHTNKHHLVLTPIYYHHNMRNLENTKISLFIRLKILRNKKNIKENKYEVILCITNLRKGQIICSDLQSARDTQSLNMQCNFQDNVNSFSCDKSKVCL